MRLITGHAVEVDGRIESKETFFEGKALFGLVATCKHDVSNKSTLFSTEMKKCPLRNFSFNNLNIIATSTLNAFDDRKIMRDSLTFHERNLEFLKHKHLHLVSSSR